MLSAKLQPYFLGFNVLNDVNDRIDLYVAEGMMHEIIR